MSGSLAGELAAFRRPAPCRRRAAAAAPGARRCTASPTPGGSGCVELLSDPDVVRRPRLPRAGRVLPPPAARPSASRCSSAAGPSCSAGPSSAAAADGGDGRVNTYLRSLLERDTAALDADIAWLDRLIADERAAEATP